MLGTNAGCCATTPKPSPAWAGNAAYPCSRKSPTKPDSQPMPKTHGPASPPLSGPPWKPCARCSRIAFPTEHAPAMTHHTAPPLLLPASTCKPPFPRLFPMSVGKPGRYPLRRTAPSLLLMDAGKSLQHLPAPTGKAPAWPPHQSKVLGRVGGSGGGITLLQKGFPSPGLSITQACSTAAGRDLRRCSGKPCGDPPERDRGRPRRRWSRG